MLKGWRMPARRVAFRPTWFLTPSCSPMQLDIKPTLWSYQFNSYYEAVGARHPRPRRGCSAALRSPTYWPGGNGWMPG